MNGWYQKNRLLHIAKVLEYRRKNHEKIKAYGKAWYRANKHKYNAYKMARRTWIKRATPIWVNKEEIHDIYLEALYQGMHVDHIIPIRSKYICGLHVTDNLQLLTEYENKSKFNKFNQDSWR